MADVGVWEIDGDAPRRVSRSGVGLEKELEDWITSDATLLADGFTIVGRQVRLDGGLLDLLAIDALQGRWVVIELKRDRLYREALAQALDYASSITQMDADELKQLLEHGAERLGDAEKISRAVRQQVEDEGSGREVAVLLAGVGVDAGLQRIVTHLGSYGVPTTIVDFQVFEPGRGSRLLIREVTEEEGAPQRAPARARSVGSIRQRAAAEEVVPEFDRFLAMAEEAGLAVMPSPLAIRIAPPTNRGRYLMYAKPEGGGMVLSAGPAPFAEFFPPLTEDEARAAIGPSDGVHLAGAALTARLDQLEAFLERLPLPEPPTAPGRDWSDLHAVLGSVSEGRWTTYGDLADAIGSGRSGARAVGQHIKRCDECPDFWRVLSRTGRPAEGFHWSDPADTRDLADVLGAEGVVFDEAGRADPAQRISVAELRAQTPPEA